MKKGKTYSVLALSGLLLWACSVDINGLDPKSLGGNSLEPVSFQNDILPIFSQSLNGQTCESCHQGAVPFGSLNLNSQERTAQQIHDDIVNGRVDKSTPEKSLILKEPIGNNGHTVMFDASSAEYKKIMNWILAGTPLEDFVPPTPTPPAGGGGTVTPTPPAVSFYASDIYPLMNGCVGCHKPGAIGSQLDLLGNNDATTSCNNVKAKAGVVNTTTPTASTLYRKPTGLTSHNGGATWTTGNQGAKVLDWIMNHGAKCQ